MRIYLRWLSVFGCCLVGVVSCSSNAGDSPPGSPATVVEAARVWNLATFPLMDGAEHPQYRNVAGLSYNVADTVKNIFEFQSKQLAEQKWKELPGGYVTDQSASTVFTRDGFSLSLMVIPIGMKGIANVTITNHGNVPLDKLPVPSDATPSYAGPVVAMFVTNTPVAQTLETCRKLLLAKGWQPYGTAGDSLFFKQNAVRLTATIASADQDDM
jgi:hypothetical protein